jgi:tRNA 2-thiouridine synthesizing protein A
VATGDTAPLQVDASGLECPLPILRTKKALSMLQAGGRVEVLSTDPRSPSDFRAFCRQAGHTLLSWDETDGRYRFVVEKRSDPS